MNEELKHMVEESDLGFLLGDNWALHHEIEFFANLVAAKKEAEMQHRIDTLHAMYEQVRGQCDQLMAQQEVAILAMRGKKVQ